MTLLDIDRSSQTVLAAAERAWDTLFNRFFSKETHLIYDYVSSYDPARRFDHLPKPDEIRAHRPNTCGWATGMEDSMLNGGVALAMVCDRHQATSDASLRAIAHEIYAGIEACGSYSSVKGLVLRSICPTDRQSYYIETSRDQFTFFIHGLWRFFHSPLSTDEQRRSITRMVVQVCELMEQRIVEENDYRFLMEDGRRGLCDKMWNVDQHEMARLPMFYALGYDLTGDEHWRRMHDQYAWQAARIATDTKQSTCEVYGLLQAQCSYELLHDTESRDPDLKAEWLKAMHISAGRAAAASGGYLKYVPQRLDDSNMDWRRWPEDAGWMKTHGYVMPTFPRILLDEHVSIREPGEAFLMQLMCPGFEFDPSQRQAMEKTLTQIEYDLCALHCMLYPLAAYWRAQRNAVEQTGGDSA